MSSISRPSDAPTTTSPAVDAELRQRRTTPRPTTVESDHSDSSTEVDPDEFQHARSDAMFSSFLDALANGRVEIVEEHLAPPPPRNLAQHNARCFGGSRSQLVVGAATGVAFASMAPMALYSEGYAQHERAAVHIVASAAFVFAAMQHGAARYSRPSPTENTEIWRAISCGAALGFIAGDALAAACGTPRLLLENYSYTPGSVMRLWTLAGAALTTQLRGPRHLLGHHASVIAFLEQLPMVAQLSMALHSHCEHLLTALLDPASVAQQPTHQQWLRALSSSSFVPAVAVALAATALVVAPRQAPGSLLATFGVVAPAAVTFATLIALSNLPKD